MPSKSIFLSKTFWVNIIALIAAIASGWGLNINAQTQAELVGGVMALLNIVMRLGTSEAVHVIPPTLRAKIERKI